jgi:Domain of unknown function (DUF4157)/OmpA family/Lysine-specific metallo-endopeptidase
MMSAGLQHGSLLRKGSPASTASGPTHATRTSALVSDRVRSSVTPAPLSIQPKLTINTPGDIHEQEADAMADRVMRMSGPGATAQFSGDAPPRVQRKCSGCSKKDDDEKVHAKETPGATPRMTTDAASRIESLRGGGEPMSRGLREYFEPRFGHDFSNVRVHTGGRAAESARSINALAYTIGSDVVFGSGQYSPGTQSGMRLMAHELTHVIQQGGRQGMIQRQSDVRELPKGLPCVTVTGPGHPAGGSTVEFTTETSVSATGDAEITAFHSTWSAAGGTDDVSIDGFASTSGDQDVNWKMSCDRAQEVKSRLVALGIPAAKITTFAHGESTEFSTTKGAPNKVAIIHSGSRLAADDLKVDRIETPGPNDTIFFERDSSKIPAGTQLGKIQPLAKANPGDLTLFGFISEDEPGGLTLAKDRIAAVEAELVNEKHGGKKTADTSNTLTAAGGQLDYRGMRRVEVKPTGVASAGPNCAGGAVIPCSPANVFTDAQAKADTLLSAAITALSPLDVANRPIFDTHFHTTSATRTSTVATVLSNLKDAQSHIKTQMAPVSTMGAAAPFAMSLGHYCANSCDGLCAGGAVAYNDGTDASAVMTLCDTPNGFTSITDVDDRAGVLIHEGLHGITFKTSSTTTIAGARDISYQHQRMMKYLDRGNSVKNSDNYVALVRELNGHVVTVGPTTVDTATGVAMSVDERERVDRALAWLEGWIVEASSQMSALYSVAGESITAGSWTNTMYEKMMAFVAPRFGLTLPPALPTADDKIALAAIAERFNRMSAVIFDASHVNIDRVAAGSTVWSSGPGVDVTIGPDFFALPADAGNNHNRLEILLRALVAATSGISADAVTRYMDIPNQLRLLLKRQNP